MKKLKYDKVISVRVDEKTYNEFITTMDHDQLRAMIERALKLKKCPTCKQTIN